MLQTSILNARFLLGLKKWKQDPIFFPIVPGVSMRMDAEINPGSTCIEGKHVWEGETKYKKMHFTVKHSNLEPIDADCKSLMFWKILEAEYVKHVHLQSFENIWERGGVSKDRKNCFNIIQHM